MNRFVEKWMALKSAIPAIVFCALFLYSCGENKNSPEYKSVPFEKMKSSRTLANINLEELVSLTDTICGMSLKDGVADTLYIESSLYGFCSSGCKSKFQSMTNKP